MFVVSAEREDSLSRTCIICGGSTGSREHIFPAALGGRRTNKGIYCADHNLAYSGLAAIIARQLAFFNAYLGVVGDHADAPTRVTMTDAESSAKVELSAGKLQFKDPMLRKTRADDGSEITGVAFPSRKEMDEWLARQKENGVEAKVMGKPKRVRFFPAEAHIELKFGGDTDGLRAIGYIAQTFFAHAFPPEARRPELQDFKDYTLKGEGSDLVWWDFEHVPERANAFDFGHRVIVGLDAASGVAYCRVSLFSTLNFAAVLGTWKVEASMAVVTDIDPLAKSPPHDLAVHREPSAVDTVSKPADTKAGLSAAISSGAAKAQIDTMMRRLIDHERQLAAAKIHNIISRASDLDDGASERLFTEIASNEAQRVLSLMRFAADDAGQRVSNALEGQLAQFLQDATERDAEAENGLSTNATEMLALACNVLAKQMHKEHLEGALDTMRIAELIGAGPGAYIVSMGLSEIFVSRLLGA